MKKKTILIAVSFLFALGFVSCGSEEGIVKTSKPEIS